jgi:hypothetical protein
MLFHDDDDAPKIRMNARQKLFIVGIDVAILIELCVAMSVATSNMDTFTPTFMKTFFTMFLPTLLLGFLGHRKLRSPMAEHTES